MRLRPVGVNLTSTYDLVRRIIQFDADYANHEAARERKRLLSELNRKVVNAPPDVLARWERDRKSHNGIDLFLQEWQADPSFGQMAQLERKRSLSQQAVSRDVKCVNTGILRLRALCRTREESKVQPG